MSKACHQPRKIILTGGAGLVGQNLIPRLKANGYTDIYVFDKNPHNLGVLRQLHPDVAAALVDLSVPGTWDASFNGTDAVVMLQAQICAKDTDTYLRNTVISTQHVLNAIRKYHVPYLVHVSSSVLESKADDWYTRTKKQQEDLVLASGVDSVILRPTLMFGLFDRKHLGWLSRFMKRVPVFPIPGDGRYLRQPLYVADFCEIIVRCIEQRRIGGVYHITGLEKVDYIDIIRAVRKTVNAHALIVHIPYRVFWVLLRTWAIFDANPPFTVSQLKALATPDVFEVIDWPTIFGVQATPFARAIREAFGDAAYSEIELEL